MRSLFPARRPRAGLALSESTMSMVELAPRWRGAIRICRLATTPLPPGLVRPNATGANIADAAELTRLLRDLLRATTQRTLAISLPMACVHVALFSFESLPDRESDRLAVLRWRFQQDEQLAVGDAEITYRVYPRSRISRAEQNGGAESTVLAVAIPRAVLHPYETVLEQAGVVPACVSWSTLQLFDLAQPLMASAAEVVCVHQNPYSWVVIIVREGQPVFLRVKPGRVPPEEEEAAIRGTLHYYDDLYPHAAADAASQPALLYHLRDEWLGGSEQEETGRMFEPVPGSAWRVQSDVLAWSRLCLQGRRPTGPSEWSALAGVLAS